MFTNIKEIQTIAFNKQLRELNGYCNEHPSIKKFVQYILDYADGEQNYNIPKSYDSVIGNGLIKAIHEISGIDISGIGNSYHFDFNWVSELNSFIGNYFLDDFSFKVVRTRMNTYKFLPSDDDNFLQNPEILIECVKINKIICDAIDEYQDIPEIDHTVIDRLIKSK